MLFFKDLYDEKMADDRFLKLFCQECHICEITVKLIAILETASDRQALLKEHGISETAYTRLKKADHCDPQWVFPLCRHLGIQTTGKETLCPRLKQNPRL